jgi:AcrR family transcriptional regulator
MRATKSGSSPPESISRAGPDGVRCVGFWHENKGHVALNRVHAHGFRHMLDAVARVEARPRPVHFRSFACYRRKRRVHRSAATGRDLELTKTRRNQKWQRDPEGMRLRILEAAKEEFASHGLAGARVDRIAVKAGANKRMLYYHVGKKDELYLAVLEGAYEKIRAEERGLDLEHLDPPEAIERLIYFTWNYFLRNPEFLALLNTENLAKARHLKRSTKVKSMHSPFVEMIRTVVRRGVASGDFVVSVDPVQLYISIAALCFFYLSNSATLSVIFGRDLLQEEARDERLGHMVALVLAALTGKSLAAFARKKPVKMPARAGQPA